jgi:hypothetical protein
LDFFKCPICGYPLSMDITRDSRGKCKIEFYCEGYGDDAFSFEIATGLSNSDIANLNEGAVLKREMKIRILERKENSNSNTEG